MKLPKILFLLALGAAVFAYGIAVGKYQIFPFALIQHVKQSFQTVFAEPGMVTGTRPDAHIHPAPPWIGEDAGGSGETEGYTLVSGFFEDGMELRLLDGQGETAHRWPVSFSDLWPDQSHIQPEGRRPQTDWNMYFNGILVERDGSVVFTYHGLVKLDACAQEVWTVPLMIHHSVEPSPRGTYWTPGSYYRVDSRDYAPLTGTFHEHTVVEVSGEGEVLREISLMEVLKQNDLLGLISANNRAFKLNPEIDIIHINDVEEIPTEYLDAFPLFDAGDLLLSLREPNLVLVLDPDTQEVKWWQIGPWNQQHDPDWQADGRITVFDNNYDGAEFGALLGGSRIISIDPWTRRTEVLYGAAEGEDFYTATQGDHQILGNGNILISEANAGRAFEVNPAGEIVWQYVHRHDDDDVILLTDAERYAPRDLDVEDWDCRLD